MALNTQKPTSGPYDIVDHNSVNADVETLHAASKKKEEVFFFCKLEMYPFSPSCSDQIL